MIVPGTFEALSIWLINPTQGNGPAPLTFPSKAQISLSVVSIHQAFEAEEPAVEVELEADKGFSQPEPEPEQISENQHPKASISQNQDSASLPSSSEPLSGYAAELKDNPNILNLQDDIPNRQDIITSRLFKRALQFI